MLGKQDIYQYLKQQNIWHEITEHEAVYTMNAMLSVALPYPECGAKNLFIRDDKKNHYYLITVCGNKRVTLKEFRKEQGTRPLTFASEEDLLRMTGLLPGSVTPLGLLNDKECRIHWFIDRDFFQEPGMIGVHPNENTATLWLKTEDLVRLIQEHGNRTDIIEII